MLAREKQWRGRFIETSLFHLKAFLPEKLSAVEPDSTEILTIYIEGDGVSWERRSRPSLDPTPVNPVGLGMALRHPLGPAAYLARPCQFGGIETDDLCTQALWTGRRFSPEVVEATNQAVSILLNEAGLKRVRLIGYSGGGAVAALVAADRDDVVQLITVAANLDHLAWTKLNRIAPLTGSLNPADAWPQLVDIPQLHLVGAADVVVEEKVLRSYANRFPIGQRPEIRVLPGRAHQAWIIDWSQIYTRFVSVK